MLGSVQINKLNLTQGPLPEVENHLLFIGECATNAGQVLAVGSETNLDTALGATSSLLKTQVEAAISNGGQNFYCSVLPITGATTWEVAVDLAMLSITCEGIVIVDPIEASTDLEAMQTKAAEIMGQYMRPVFFMAAARPLNSETETWANYIAAINPLAENIAADQVCVIPYLWGHDLGTLAGRLCNRAVTVADTPMRVKTGPLLGEWSDRPVDKDGIEITMAELKQLDANRFSVPQWYPDYPGTYWGDGNMLDVPGGDFQSVENLRVILKAMRKVYPLAVARVGDRLLNSTPASIAYNKMFFMRPLREMAKAVTIQGIPFPGEIHPPTDDAIEIVWKNKTTVEIYIMVRPFNCPKNITVNLALDLSVE